jgi:DNA (cytosine-5)-methyltransferase 1
MGFYLDTIMRHGSLFTGIGGFDLAAQWMGWDNVFQCELDEWCLTKLNKNFPKIKRHKDIKTFDAKIYKGKIDILTGGYPCQPFSVAGSQKAKEDDRHLWPFMYERIKEILPNWIVCENVYGHIELGLDEVLNDLANIGYTSMPFVIPATSKGANHNRRRVYIVAYSSSNGLNEGKATLGNDKANDDSKEGTNENSDNEGCSGLWSTMEWGSKTPWGWGVEPPTLRVDDGLPERMDRIKGLGNAIVPQVALEIFKVIGKLNYP